jgi:hypothetical protein
VLAAFLAELKIYRAKDSIVITSLDSTRHVTRCSWNISLQKHVPLKRGRLVPA